jgi:hypothetical protein
VASFLHALTSSAGGDASPRRCGPRAAEPVELPSSPAQPTTPAKTATTNSKPTHERLATIGPTVRGRGPTRSRGSSEIRSRQIAASAWLRSSPARLGTRLPRTSSERPAGGADDSRILRTKQESARAPRRSAGSRSARTASRSDLRFRCTEPDPRQWDANARRSVAVRVRNAPRGRCARRSLQAFDRMAAAARREAGLALLVTSGYRSDAEQAASVRGAHRA